MKVFQGPSKKKRENYLSFLKHSEATQQFTKEVILNRNKFNDAGIHQVLFKATNLQQNYTSLYQSKHDKIDSKRQNYAESAAKCVLLKS